MPIPRFLAMTAAEFQENREYPDKIGWMACHFSPYSTGLSNLPRALPAESLLIVDDYTPMQGHDPDVIARQMGECVEALGCWGVLLDFQRPGNDHTAALAKRLTQALPCPVGVSEGFARELDRPVFLSPVPPNVPLSEYLAPWQGREVWLDMTLAGERITLTEEGAQVTALPASQRFSGGFWEEDLHCHYRIETAADKAVFTLWRTREDLDALLTEAEEYGVTTAVGLWQELNTPALGEGQ